MTGAPSLSGGQRQRVAMGRAIVREPQAFLMDEPLSNLDAQLRVQTRAEIRRLQRELGITTVYVTHDQTEAMTMGDHVAVMRSGDLQQVDTPGALYDRPVNRFVAGFLGSPAMNLVSALMQREEDDLVVEFGEQRLVVDPELARSRPALDAYEGRTVVLGIRPEDIEDASLAGDTPPTRRLTAVCELREALGSEVLVHFTVAAPPGTDHEDKDRSEAQARHTGTVFVARLDPRTRLREGERVNLAVDTRGSISSTPRRDSHSTATPRRFASLNAITPVRTVNRCDAPLFLDVKCRGASGTPERPGRRR